MNLVTELADEISPLASHIGVAHWQYKQFRQLKANLPTGQLLTLMDFAENYRCEFQKEVQAAHWSYSQVTVFPTVNYYRYDLILSPNLFDRSLDLVRVKKQNKQICILFLLNTDILNNGLFFCW